MTPSPRKKNLGLANPRGRNYKGFSRKKLDRQIDELRRLLKQQSASQEQDAWQPRLATETDGPANTKTRERTEGVATAVRVVHGDTFSARKVEPSPKTTSTSFGMKAEPPEGGRGPRCGAQVVSPILGDAPTTSCRWLTPRRRHLYGNIDHPQQVVSSALCNRGDEFKGEKNMDLNSIRLERKQLLETTYCPLLPEGH